MRRITALTVVLAAGTAAALFAFPATAAPSWDWQNLPAGYTVSAYQTCYDDQGVNHWSTGCGSIPVCDHITITSAAGGFGEADCVPSFQADLDGYVNSTVCSVNPAAAGDACPAPATTTAATTDTTTTASPPTATATTVVTDTTPSGPSTADLQTQIVALQQQVQAIQDELTALVKILVQWPGIDPGILAQLMALG